MTELIAEMLNKMIGEAFGYFDSLMISLIENMLYVEKLFSNVLSADSIMNVYNYIYAFACALVCLKFLAKGFKIYILWRDGEADSSIQDMLVGIAQAAFVMAGFPYLYDLMTDVTKALSNGIMGKFGLAEASATQLFQLYTSTGMLFELIIILVYAIMVFVLYIMLIKRGVELMVLRLGVPFAALGLVDSDLGVFKGYMQTLVKTLLTSIIQITLLSLSIRIMTNFGVVNLICGMAVISTAFSTPALMQNLLIPTGSTNIINKVYT
ncbi:MAG: DUF6102 family protein, partial [Acinetobacter sp.]